METTMPINESSPYPERPPDEARWTDENYIGHDQGFAGEQPDHSTTRIIPHVEGQALIDRMSALVLFGRLERTEVQEIIDARDWKRARRLIRSVRDTRPLPEQP
jgi:hypothetical protein